MRSSSVLNRYISGIITFMMVSACLILGAVQSVRAQNESTVLLNEVSVNPGGTDQPYEWVELTGNPNTSLNNLYLVIFEGDGSTAGIADLALNLSTSSIGSSGFLLYKAETGGPSVPAGTTDLEDTRLNAGSTTSPFENGTTSIVLISSPTNPMVQATDYDSNNDGVLELPVGAVIQDAVGWKDTTPPAGTLDFVYGGVTLAQVLTPPATSGTIDAATRVVGDTTPLSASAWYAGDYATSTNSNRNYDTTNKTANMPSGARVTPGTTNYAAPVILAADLSLTGSVDDTSPDEAQSITYTFTVSNAGPDATNGVTVGITLPTGVTYTSNDAGAPEASGFIDWTIGSLASGASAAIQIVAHADNAALGPQFKVVGQVTASGEDDPDSTPNNMVGTSVAEDDEAEVFITVVSAVTCSGSFTPIYNLQENGANYDDITTVFTVEGIVVGDYQSAGNTGLRGFYLQDETGDANPATSDGIFVFDSANTVSVNEGDRVRVSGTVSEFSDQTRLNASNIEPCGTTGTITATPVSLPFASTNSAENYEGMLVTFTQTLTVSDVSNLGTLGQVVLSSGGRLFNPTAITTPGANANAQDAANDLNHIYLDDGINKQNPDPTPYLFDDGSGLTLRAGDTVANLNGILGQRNDSYLVQPVDDSAFVRSNPRTAVPAVAGDLTVASFNLMNYFNGPTFPTSLGASSTREFTRQRNKTIAAISQMNADVIGLTEIENDAASGSAIQNLVAGLNAVMGAGTYAFIDTGVNGTEETRVAILYKPASVTPLGSFMIDTNGIYTYLPLAQTFEDNTTGGIFTVIVNSFKSRGCVDAADLNLDQGDGQSCYNQQRSQQSNALLNFISDDVVPASGDSDVLILGDLNAYTFEDPITRIETSGYTNLIRSLLGTSAYAYVSNGEAGYLDHALASSSLVAQVADVDHWHINADEPRVLDYQMEGKSDAQDALNVGTPYRASDHDPVLIGLSLTSDVDATVSMRTLTDSGTEASAGQVSVEVVLNLGNSNGFSISEVVASVMLSGSAVENSDYTVGRSSVTFPAGSVDGATKTLTLTIEDDSLVEADETIVVTLNGASNALVGADDTFTYHHGRRNGHRQLQQQQQQRG